MPYYVHHKDADPLSAELVFTSRIDAMNATKDGTDLVFTFLINNKERTAWQCREWQRFEDGQYLEVPWTQYRSEWCPSDDPGYVYPHGAEVSVHFVHLSLKTPGAIAYTPSDEHGFQDRQVTIKVGRYLTQYYTPYLTQAEIDSYVEQIKAYSADFKIARRPEEIVRVYRGGPHSCMSADASNYSTRGIHPVEVYGNSDLGVAYLGDLDHVRARVLVWPDKKYYTRVYGDRTLSTLLKNNGYTCPSTGGGNYPSFAGAKIRAMPLPRGNGYVMPYVDCASSADLSHDGKHFILRDHAGEYEVKETDGTTNIREVYYCQHCECEIDEDEAYCESCNDNHISCDRCGDDMFDSDDWVTIDEEYTYCTSCASRDDCETHVTECSDCGTTIDDRERNDDPDCQRCDSCYEAHTHEDDEDGIPEDKEDETEDEEKTKDRYPTIDDTIVILDNGYNPYTCLILYSVGALVVHETINETGYTITHVYSGRVVTIRESLGEACALVDKLTHPGIDWGFTSRLNMPDETFAYASRVLFPTQYDYSETCVVPAHV